MATKTMMTEIGLGNLLLHSSSTLRDSIATQDKAGPNYGELMPHWFPPWASRPDSNLDPNSDPNLDLEADSNPTHRLEPAILRRSSNLLRHRCPRGSQSLQHRSSRCQHPVSSLGVLTSFLTVDSAWERHIESAERVCIGMEEGVKRRLIELATSRKEITTTHV